MTTRVNMADADFEPTDEDLSRLVTEAFAGVKAANDKALSRFWQEIALATKGAPATARKPGDPTPRP